MASQTFPEVTITQWSSDDISQRFPVENPATGKVLTTVAGGDADTATKAIEASQKAFATWRHVPPMQRAAYLLKAADALNAKKEELATILCLENGKPYQDALQFDVGFLVGVFRFFGSIVDKLPSEFYDRGAMYATVLHEPYGVCVGILPFNWPPIHTGGKLAPCLAAGNTMILKPGDQAPLTVLRIVNILQTVLPENVVMAVPGNGVSVPQALVSHPTVRAVSFTGSTRGGSAVAQTAAKTVKPSAMELGGKNAFIVFEDADLDRAVGDALDGAFFNKGEACTAASRLIVHESIHDVFVSRLSAAVKSLVSGNGMDKATHVGPCVSKEAKERVLKHIRAACNDGAMLAAQGELPSDPSLRNGFFVPPTLFTNVFPDMAIAKEEVFGPVAAVIKFATEQEALDIANGTPFGLTAIIFSKDHERCLRLARQLDVGMIWFNQYLRAVLGTPFGGANDSGYGREHCIETLRDWTRAKTIHQPSGLGVVPQWRAVKDCCSTE